MSRFTLAALGLALLLPGTVAAQDLHKRQELRGAVAVDTANDATTVVVAVDVGADGSTDHVFTLDLEGTPKTPIYYRFANARVLYILGERRLQISAPDEGALMLLGKRGSALLAEPEPALAETPALWLETQDLGHYPLSEPRPSLEEAIELFRNSKAEAAAAREARRENAPAIIEGTEPRNGSVPKALAEEASIAT